MRFFHLVFFGLAALLPVIAQGEEFRMEISKADCDRIVKYVADQNVTYTPGVDVHGKSVAPADVESSQIQLPEKIFIDLSIPFKDLLNQYNPKLKNAEIYAGLVEYDLKTGRMLYNGQELSDPAQNAIAMECRKRYQ